MERSPSSAAPSVMAGLAQANEARLPAPPARYTGRVAQQREIVLHGKRFDVERRPVARRDGGTELREVVVHPGAVVILALLDDGRVLLIRNRRFTVDKTLW